MASSGWRERWIAWRNARLSDFRFQQWAADQPLTRQMARRRARTLFDLAAGFVYSQTLAAFVRLGLLEALFEGPLHLDALALRTGMAPAPLKTLLQAGAVLGLCEALRSDERWALGADGAALLGNPGLLRMIAHHERFYADLTDPVALLQNGGGQGQLAAYWPYATSHTPDATAQAAVADYSALMAATQPAVAADILKAYPVSRHRRLLDAGGGEGAFLCAAGSAADHLQLMLFDLPAVTERARSRLDAAGLLARTEILAGDFLSEPFPKGADLITLIRILHDHDDEGVNRLLRSAREALAADGALLIAEPMSGGVRGDRVGDVYFAFYLTAMGRGKARTPDDLARRLRAAGFSRTRLYPTRTPSLLRVLVAQP
jgi:demethylspheroidene O-methyltransferase